MVVESRSRDFPVQWTRETFSTPDKPDVERRVHVRVIKAADRQDVAAPASKDEVRATLSRVADCLSSMEETPSPSKCRATFVKYEEVMCSRKLCSRRNKHTCTHNGSVNSKHVHHHPIPGICHLVGPGGGICQKNSTRGWGIYLFF